MPNVVKSLFPLTLQYYLNAVSHGSALSRPQTALRKSRGDLGGVFGFSCFWRFSPISPKRQTSVIFPENS